MAVRTTAQRGYGGAHQKLRAALLRKVDGGAEWCARCGRWIAPTGQPCMRCGRPTRSGGKAGRGFCGFDLGHVDGDKTQYQGAEHACCNRASAAHRKVRGGRRRAAWW